MAIHQPTFFPWLGFFDKLRRADTFVLLDGVQFARRHGGGGNWVNRVRILVAGAAAWITVPVKRANVPLQPISDLEIADEMPWRAKLLRTLKLQYGRAPHFDQTMALVTPLIEFATPKLAEFNEHAIRTLAVAVGAMPATMTRQTSLGVTGQSNALLSDLVRIAGGTTYLSGDGADDYLDSACFERAGVSLTLQHFQHPEYPQGTPAFVPGLSIVDALMHCGVDGVRALLRGGESR
ncbi:MAG TPA: WbqC family protein [Vicinamibacterales bacterium]|nr:WbqC family protein [Vicinamibacterales bacterium]